MKKLSGKWEASVPTLRKGDVKGDEIRRFTTKEGQAVELTVSLYSYWKWSVRIDGDTVSSDQGFGVTSKAVAKRRAETEARKILSKQESK